MRVPKQCQLGDAAMPRIYKRGKSWYIDVRVKGQRYRKCVGHSKRIAELALKDTEVKIARDQFGFTKHDISIDRLLERFREYSRINHSRGTQIRYGSVVDSFQRFLSQHRRKVNFVSQITPELIEQYKECRKDAGVNYNGREVGPKEDGNENTHTGVRPDTVNFELKVLTSVFNLAIKWGYLKVNPTKGVARFKVTRSRPVRFLTEEECRRFLAACPEDFYPIYFTYLNTGMRKTELLYLEWEDIDFRRRKIKIRQKDDWQPKSSEREIPINGQLLELLKNLKASNDQGLCSRWAFPHADGGRLRTKLREKMIEIAEQAGIENLTKLHTLRHTFASHLVMKGVDLPTVKKLMGHADIQTTMIYAHLAPDHLAEAVDRLEF
jgi:integrase